MAKHGIHPQKERGSNFTCWKKAQGRRNEKPPVGNRCHGSGAENPDRVGGWDASGPHMGPSPQQADTRFSGAQTATWGTSCLANRGGGAASPRPALGCGRWLIIQGEAGSWLCLHRSPGRILTPPPGASPLFCLEHPDLLPVKQTLKLKHQNATRPGRDEPTVALQADPLLLSSC